MRYILLSSTLLLCPAAATAESQAKRFETLTADMTRVMWGMMAAEVEKEGGDGVPIRAAIDNFAWSDAMATATDCVLDRYNTEIGTSEVDDLFDRMESMIASLDGMTITEFSDQIDPAELMPDGLTEDQTLAINEECGMTDAQLDMMQDSGFSAALMSAMAASQ